MSEKSSSPYRTKLLWFDEGSYRLKEAGPGVVGPPTTLINLLLHSNRVLNEWKEAIVCPILKEARQDPTNYRPIPLNSWVARTMEKLVNSQMLAFLSENSLLYQHQSGFLSNHSTVTQLCYLTHQWQVALEKEDQCHFEAHFVLSWDWALPPPFLAVHNTPCLTQWECQKFPVSLFLPLDLVLIYKKMS